MTKDEIKKDIKKRIKKLGVKNAYLDIVVANAKVIKTQLFNLKKSDMGNLIQLAHSISVKGIKDANMFSSFKYLFVNDFVIHDEVYEESIELIINSLKE